MKMAGNQEIYVDGFSKKALHNKNRLISKDHMEHKHQYIDESG